MTDTKPTTEEQLQVALSRVAELTKTVDILENGKTVSEVFWNVKNAEYMKYSSLSETKLYFEKNHLDFLKSISDKLTSAQFHKALTENLFATN